MVRRIILVGEEHNCRKCAKEEIKILRSNEIDVVIWEPLCREKAESLEEVREVIGTISFYKSHKDFLEEVFNSIGIIYGIENHPPQKSKSETDPHYMKIFELSKKMRGNVLLIVGKNDVEYIEKLYVLEGITSSSIVVHPFKGRSHESEKYKTLYLSRKRRKSAPAGI